MIIRVRVFPNSKREEIIKKSDDFFEVTVQEKPIGGQANKGVIRVLSSYFKVPEARIKLIRGFREPRKVFRIEINSR